MLLLTLALVRAEIGGYCSVDLLFSRKQSRLITKPAAAPFATTQAYGAEKQRKG